ncbi:MAG: hypothetical protein K2H37_03490 [Lachnospiraceae bacterium]|nr:hypothetical protein [Lachnospiraceae bacterium]
MSEENTVTCREWIEMLTEQMGIQEYTAETDTNFDGEDFATGQFIAVTAMKAVGESKFRISLGTKDAITDDTYVEFALEYGIVEEERLKKGFTREECEQVLETLKRLYFTEFWKDNYSDVVYHDDVIELSPKSVLRSDINGTEIAVTDDVIRSCKTGDIIVFTQENTNLKLARKIIDIDSAGTLTLDTVELNEVVESLTVSDIVEVTFDDIMRYYGLDKKTGASNDLLHRQTDSSFMDASLFSGSVNSEGYKLTVTTQGEDEKRGIVVQITENATGITYTIPISDKVSRNDDYAAEINIDKICVGGQVDYSFLGGLKYAEAAVDAHATFKSEIKAEKEKPILLFETPVPLGNGILGAKIKLYLVLSVNGNITFEAELPIEASVSYEQNRGLRKFDHRIAVEDPTIEVNCDAGAGIRVEPVLMVLGCPNVMDVEIEIGVSAAAKVNTRPNSQICSDLSVSFPVMTVSVCGDDEIDTIIGALGISGEWEIITSEDAPKKLGLHYEIIPGKGMQFVKECTYVESREDVSETVQRKEAVSDGLSEFTQISDYEGPIELWINAPFEDAGEYYIVKGDLQVSYSILQREFNKLHAGDHFTVLDKEFVLGDRLETEDFPAEIYAVYCVNDDCSYYIQTKVALDFGSINFGYPICRSVPDYDAVYESMEILYSDLDIREIKIAKGTDITSLTAMGEIAYTAEECFENHVLIDDWLDIANFSSVYGELDFPIHCYTAFDENGEIASIVWDSFG